MSRDLRSTVWAWGAIVVLFTGCGEHEPPTSPNQTDRCTAQSASAQPLSEPRAAGFTPADHNTEHRIAKRSAFPQAGEPLDRLIPANRLSEQDPFYLDDQTGEVPTVHWQQAKQYLGRTIIVQGPIVTVGQSRDGKINFLNFHPDWRGKFYLVLFDDLAQTLDKSVEETFAGKAVRVRGRVEAYNGRPQIKIRSMDQVEFVDD